MPDVPTAETLKKRAPSDDREANGRWLKGHHTGRPNGAMNKRRQTAQEIFDKYDFDPLEKKILLCRRLEMTLLGNHFKDIYEKIEYLKLYAETLKDVLQYGYQRLKAVEHFGQIDLIQKLQNLDGKTDEELQQLLADAEELIRVHA